MFIDMQYVQGKPLFTYINKNKKQYPYLTLMCEILSASISGRWIALDDSQQEQYVAINSN